MTKTQERKPLFIASADWHYSDTTWVGRPGYTGDADASLNCLSNLLQRYKIPLVAAGDLLNVRHPSTAVLADFQGWLDCLDTSHGFLYVQGQHEMSEPSWVSLLQPARDDVSVCRLGRFGTLASGQGRDALFYGFNWCNKKTLQDNLRDLQERNEERKASKEKGEASRDILVLHQSYAGWSGYGEAELESGMIPDFIDMVICGDTHITEAMTIARTDGVEIPILSPGSLYLRSTSESTDKFVYLVYDDLSFEAVPIPQRYIFSSLCDSEESFESALQDFKKVLQARLDVIGDSNDVDVDALFEFEGKNYETSLPPAIFLTVDVDKVDDAKKRVLHVYPHPDLVFIKTVDEDSQDGDTVEDLQQLKNSTEVLKVLPLVVDAEKRPKLFSLLEKLLSSNDARQDLSEFVTGYLEQSTTKRANNE